MLVRASGERSPVDEVTHSGFRPSCSMRTTWSVLSWSRASPSTPVRFSWLRQALHTPWSSRCRSGWASGITQGLQQVSMLVSLER